MQILFLAPHLPYPPYSGSRIRMFEMIKHFQRKHSVTIVSFVENDSERRLAEVELSKYCTSLHLVERKSELSRNYEPRPRRVVHCSSAAMYRLVRDINYANNFDVVIADHLYMAQYAPLVDAFRVLDENNIESHLIHNYAISVQQQKYGLAAYENSPFVESSLEWRKLQAYEDITWYKFQLRLTMSQYDYKLMSERCPIGETIVVPNGVNASQFLPGLLLDSHNVFFVGRLDYQPNYEAAFELIDEIMPLVRIKLPDAKLFIAGSKVPEALLLQRSEQVQIFADVADITPIARQCSVAAVPLRAGGGTRLKILTTMALGLPTVSTALGAEGLDLNHGQQIMLAESPSEIANTIVDLIADKYARNYIAQAARRHIEETYDWGAIYSHFEQILVERIANRS